MRDPETLIGCWPPQKSWIRFFIRLEFQLWHVDPESDGSDDSCGWSVPKISKELLGTLKFEARAEARHPWLQRELAKQPQSVADAEHLLRGAVLHTAHLCGITCNYQRACLIAARLMHNPINNIRSSLCFAPGYHSNSREDRVDDRTQHAFNLYTCIARHLLTQSRPWYRHPRWHIQHWRLHVQENSSW
jgi:hypothetical protein